MKQLGNLAIVCAKRRNVLLQMMNGTVAIHIKGIPRQRLLTAQWDDDAKISSIIHELNYGKYKEETL